VNNPEGVEVQAFELLGALGLEKRKVLATRKI